MSTPDAWEADKRASWARDLPKTEARIAALPVAFQDRIAFFRRNLDWGWSFGPYELFVCEEAVKLAAAFPTRAELRAFHALDHGAQRAALPSLSDDHSGNTFGSAMTLALGFVERPELLVRMHGALCPLVGCKDYGCWASTPEAKR